MRLSSKMQLYTKLLHVPGFFHTSTILLQELEFMLHQTRAIKKEGEEKERNEKFHLPKPGEIDKDQEPPVVKDSHVWIQW